jgi:hypothetical protein
MVIVIVPKSKFESSALLNGLGALTEQRSANTNMSRTGSNGLFQISGHAHG